MIYLSEFNKIPLPELSTETRKSRRNLTISSFFLFSLYYLSIKVSKINMFNIELTTDQTDRCVYLLIIVCIYELSTFLFRFYSDYTLWYYNKIAQEEIKEHSNTTRINRALSVNSKSFVIYPMSLIFGRTYYIALQDSNGNYYRTEGDDIDSSTIKAQWKIYRNRMLLFWMIEVVIPVVFSCVAIIQNIYHPIISLIIKLAN